MKRTKAPARGPSSTACVLVSGGVDSAVLLVETLRRHARVQPLYVRAGLHWERVEQAHLRRFLAAVPRPGLLPLATIDVPMSDLDRGHWSSSGVGTPVYEDDDASVYIPGRNIALFSKAATFCALHRIHVLVSGILSANPFPDGRPVFLRAMARALTLGLGSRLAIRTPFRGLTKDKVVRRGRDLPLHLTFSCINPKRGRHCRACCKCRERIEAFAAAGIADRTAYAPVPAAVPKPPESSRRISSAAAAARRARRRAVPNTATSVR
ncbi:MAG TPA: 7-cyano-7-deazaguanine synthase [Candidatus Polarisedimenticolia bacterium]|nr:7-cyano-7-deazaguanine synthase [Candidatus Polarisedimenticolia bacterium]